MNDVARFMAANAAIRPRPSEAEMASHPLAWMRAHMTEGAFVSWIWPLTVSGQPGALTLTAPLALTRDRVIQDWGHLIRRQLGDVEWRIEGTS